MRGRQPMTIPDPWDHQGEWVQFRPPGTASPGASHCIKRGLWEGGRPSKVIAYCGLKRPHAYQRHTPGDGNICSTCLNSRTAESFKSIGAAIGRPAFGQDDKQADAFDPDVWLTLISAAWDDRWSRAKLGVLAQARYPLGILAPAVMGPAPPKVIASYDIGDRILGAWWYGRRSLIAVLLDTGRLELVEYHNDAGTLEPSTGGWLSDMTLRQAGGSTRLKWSGSTLSVMEDCAHGCSRFCTDTEHRWVSAKIS